MRRCAGGRAGGQAGERAGWSRAVALRGGLCRRRAAAGCSPAWAGDPGRPREAPSGARWCCRAGAKTAGCLGRLRHCDHLVEPLVARGPGDRRRRVCPFLHFKVWAPVAEVARVLCVQGDVVCRAADEEPHLFEVRVGDVVRILAVRSAEYEWGGRWGRFRAVGSRRSAVGDCGRRRWAPRGTLSACFGSCQVYANPSAGEVAAFAVARMCRASLRPCGLRGCQKLCVPTEMPSWVSPLAGAPSSTAAAVPRSIDWFLCSTRRPVAVGGGPRLEWCGLGAGTDTIVVLGVCARQPPVGAEVAGCAAAVAAALRGYAQPVAAEEVNRADSITWVAKLCAHREGTSGWTEVSALLRWVSQRWARSFTGTCPDV